MNRISIKTFPDFQGKCRELLDIIGNSKRRLKRIESIISKLNSLNSVIDSGISNEENLNRFIKKI